MARSDFFDCHHRIASFSAPALRFHAAALQPRFEAIYHAAVSPPMLRFISF